ncbi:hypothetical protein FIBSPDRAFT_938560 [Athelia psychrophila]|uniref:MIF4G domain-containing protein n=1 Tax=Athelia psychrophila TaxID=1759441 RepID=A0A165Y6Q4_9AGAM|nr:hypothetical protein FIBSPDRAFT_938560 [Fibularhizoctonia sp. CBS 109695]
MSKPSTCTATAQKIPTSAPTTSAWAKGPPSGSTVSTPRSQSPAPGAATPPAIGTHSRKPGILGQVVGIKYGVSVPRNTVGTKQGLAVTFVSIDDDSAPISSFPATAKTSSRLDPSLQSCKRSSAQTPPTESASSPSVRPANLPPQQLQYPPQGEQSQPPPPPAIGRPIIHASATLSRDTTMARVLRSVRPPGGLNGPGGGQMKPGLSSPRLSHQHPQHPGQSPNMPPQQQQRQPMPVPGWPGHYYQQDPYMQQAYCPQQWYMPDTPIPQQQHMAPQLHPHPPGMPMSPRNPQMSLQPGTPTQSPALTHQPRTPTTAASATSHRVTARYALDSCVPEQQHPTWHQLRKPAQHIWIKAADGSEVDLKAISSKRASPGLPGLPPSSPSASGFNRTANGHRSGKSQIISTESEEARQKRVAEEKAKADRERAVKEAEERVKKDAEEKVQREEEARVAAIEKAAEDEEERARKDEEEKERIRKEAEEAERVQAEEAERDAERAKEEEAVAAAAAVTAAATAAAAKEKDEGEKSVLSINTAGPSQEAHKPRPGPLDLSHGKTPITPGLPSALATARIIEKMEYREGITSPKLEPNVNAKGQQVQGKANYCAHMYCSSCPFARSCKEKPDQLPPLGAIGLEPVDMFSMSRGGSGRHRTTSMQMGPPGPLAGSIGLGIGNFAKPGGSFSMGNFATPGGTGKSSEERFAASNRAVSVGGAGAPAPFGHHHPWSAPPAKVVVGRWVPTARGASGARSAPTATRRQGTSSTALTAAIPGKKVATIDPDSPEMVDRKVKGLLNKLTMEKFNSISDQIITWANKSETEKDGQTLIQVIRLVFEKATDEAAWSETYARLCRKMMEKISASVQDDGIKNNEGKPIAGGQLFWKYLLNRCQEDFERGWAAKDAAAAAAAAKAGEDDAIKAANDKNKDAPAKRQGLGLIKFIGELFKLQMLTERIMHECVKKLLGNVENPEDEKIESLCKLLSTVGTLLDTPKARAHMDVYFSRMKELTRSGNVTSRMQFMLQDVVELRDRKWNTCNVVAAPTTLAAVHDLANKDRAAAERESAQRMNSMSRTGSQRGGERGQYDQQGPDGWTVTGESGGRGNPRPPPKAGDLSNFGKINKAVPMTFGPTSVFAKGKEGAKGPRTEPISRSSSSSNMFSMLSQNSEIAADASGPKPTTSRPASRKTSIDLGTAGVPEAPLQRRKLQLLPRSKMTQDSGDGTAASAPVSENDEVEESGTAADSMPEVLEGVLRHAELGQGRELLPEAHARAPFPPRRHCLVDKLVNTAIESKAVDAQLVSDFFARAHSKDLCSEASFEEGFMPIAELLDDIAIDAPKAFDLMAVMVKGASFSEDARGRIAAISVDSEKLLALLST